MTINKKQILIPLELNGLRIDSAVHNYHNQKYLAPLHSENEKVQLKPLSSPMKLA